MNTIGYAVKHLGLVLVGIAGIALISGTYPCQGLILFLFAITLEFYYQNKEINPK
jgi:hypothetical protein